MFPKIFICDSSIPLGLPSEPDENIIRALDEIGTFLTCKAFKSMAGKILTDKKVIKPDIFLIFSFKSSK